MTEVIIAKEKAKEVSFKLLSACYQLPDKDWKTVSLLEGLVQALETANSKAVDSAKKMLEIVEGTEDFTDLQVDFAKLFVGPDRLLAAPYGSVYLDGGRRVMGDSTMAALAFYDKIGLQMSKEQKELPDHIEVELEVMYFLLYKERTLRKEDNAELADAYLADIKEFLTEQIGAWVDAFVGDVEKEAEQEFYKLLADVTRTLIAEEKQRFLNKDLH